MANCECHNQMVLQRWPYPVEEICDFPVSLPEATQRLSIVHPLLLVIPPVKISSWQPSGWKFPVDFPWIFPLDFRVTTGFSLKDMLCFIHLVNTRENANMVDMLGEHRYIYIIIYTILMLCIHVYSRLYINLAKEPELPQTAAELRISPTANLWWRSAQLCAKNFWATNEMGWGQKKQPWKCHAQIYFLHKWVFLCPGGTPSSVDALGLKKTI